MAMLPDPRRARVFRFVRRELAGGEARLTYAFDDGPELVERIVFPGAPESAGDRRAAIDAALEILHFVAGISYYKAGVPDRMAFDVAPPNAGTAAFLDTLYLDGLGEFAYRNRLDLRGRIRFPRGAAAAAPAAPVTLPRSSLVAIGGGKDSLVSVEMLRAAGERPTVAWVGESPLIRACAGATASPALNIGRELSPLLFQYNAQGAWNGHIPVTAINSAILVLAAVLFGHDAVVFSNERSASSATLEYDGQPVNHQWSKSWAFEQAFRAHVHVHVAPNLDYYSLLRPLPELAVAARFARTRRYDAVFSSCNRNFRILGPKPADRWCGVCPKCHFVFLALAPFMPKPRLLSIFGRNLLDDASLVPAFDALMEYRDHKPFECVGEGIESRAAMAALAARAEWREDAVVAHFVEEVAPQVDLQALALAPLLAPAGPHAVPARLLEVVDALH